ncbi:MAG: alpha/beta hydrolase [Rhodoferax sp.]|nr:alpha/beta hydrolase [Rhodoferax sp.]
MNKPESNTHLRASDIRAIAQLATQATLGVSKIAEGVQQAVWSTVGVPGGKEPGTTRGITGLVYQTVNGITELVGKGAQALLEGLEPMLDMADDAAPGTPEREAVLAALNGVMGDRLAASNNPLATHMTLRYRGEALDWQALPADMNASAKVLVLIHGLCMNDIQWQTPRPTQPDGEENDVIDHGASLSAALGYTPIYVRYNTGLHTSQNAHELSSQLEQLVSHWPVPVQEITVLAHSMGGLVTRGAVYYAGQEQRQWLQYLKNIIFLGTPHHGSPLERAGNWVDVILGSTPYTAPFAKLGQLRSAGITDLRFGHVLDADWQGHDRFDHKPDERQIVPLPEGVACYCVAATTAAERSELVDHLVGDGLVPLHSALGEHDDTRRSLAFAPSAQLIVYRTSHLDLLTRSKVTRQIVQWLRPQPA